jgi:asparagine synthase (glutamine-hydrolysing)
MCGIAGFAGFDNPDLLRAMAASLVHRGPDAGGFHTAPGVGLASRRLAVIDLETGDQPIANETRDVWVVFNGEIYNCDALRAELEARGHRFTTTTDTECIVHLYEDLGLEFVQKLRGMFAIALWDEAKRRLVLARDRIGEKPLYFRTDGDRLLFGSECKAILQAMPSRSVDCQAICDYLALGYVAAPATFYQGIAKLPPAHMLVFESGRATMRRYWSRAEGVQSQLSLAAAEDELAHRLVETIGLCLKSDVEVGAFLSGGIDSSVIVALMRQHDRRVKTFSVGYQGPATGFNELHDARRVAKDLGTEHHELILGAGSHIDLLPSVLWHYDEPNGEPTSVLVYQLSQFVSRSVKVAMSGTAGDEIFAGYPRYRAADLRELYLRMPGVVRRQVVDRIVSAWPASTRGSRFARRAKRFIAGASLSPAAAYASWVSLLQRDVREQILSEQVKRGAEWPEGDRLLRDYLIAREDRPLLDRATALDVEAYLPEYQLTYVDRMSMAHSLEVRAPLADHTLVDFVTTLPMEYRLKGSHSKHIFKRVAGRWIDPAIAERKKVGFDSPVGEWFKGELKPFLAKFMAREQIAKTGLLDPPAVERLIGEHMAGKSDASLQIWSLLTLEAWHRLYIEGGVMDGRTVTLDDLRGAGRDSGAREIGGSSVPIGARP